MDVENLPECTALLEGNTMDPMLEHHDLLTSEHDVSLL